MAVSYSWSCVSPSSLFPCTDRFDEPLVLLAEESSDVSSEIYIESSDSDDSSSSALLYVAIGLVFIGGGGAGALVVLH